jgi:2-methylcitrate dehydratase
LPAHQVKAIMAAVKDPAQLDAMPLNHFLGFFTL